MLFIQKEVIVLPIPESAIQGGQINPVRFVNTSLFISYFLFFHRKSKKNLLKAYPLISK